MVPPWLQEGSRMWILYADNRKIHSITKYLARLLALLCYRDRVTRVPTSCCLTCARPHPLLPNLIPHKIIQIPITRGTLTVDCYGFVTAERMFHASLRQPSIPVCISAVLFRMTWKVNECEFFEADRRRKCRREINKCRKRRPWTLQVFQLIMFHHLTETVEVICKWFFTHTERVLQLWALMLLLATSAQLAPFVSDCWAMLAWSVGKLALQMKREAAFPGVPL